jgi:hypothetical protein
MISVLPTYTPPPAHFDWYEAPKPIIQNTAGSSSDGKKKKPKKATKK